MWIAKTLVLLALLLGPLPAAASDRPAGRGFTVAVLGDGFGEDLAEGLRLNLAGEPDVTILNRTHPPYGLSEDQTFAWTTVVQTLFASQTPVDAVVIMLGVNDRRPLRDGAATVQPDAPRWAEVYGDRVQALAAAIRAKGVPVTWVGLPITGDEDTSAGFSALNEIVRDRSVKGGATYVDSWDAFVNEDGKYSQVGPDVNGRVVRLRMADNFDLTRAGARKLASFVEPELRRDRDRSAPAAPAAGLVIPDQPEASDIDINAQIRREAGLEARPAEGGRAPAQAGPVINLSAPAVSADGRLVQRTGSAVADIGGTLAQRALVEGQPVQPRAGRMDDFAWPRP